jgi:hypothetical protein
MPTPTTTKPRVPFGTSPFEQKLRRDTKRQVVEAEARLKALRRFEQMINPQARPRRNRKAA